MRVSARLNAPKRQVGAQLSAKQSDKPQTESSTICNIVGKADTVVMNAELAMTVGIAQAPDRQFGRTFRVKRVLEGVRDELVHDQGTRNSLFDRELDRLHFDVETARAGDRRILGEQVLCEAAYIASELDSAQVRRPIQRVMDH